MNDTFKYYFEQLKELSQSIADPLFAYEMLIHGPALLAALSLLLVLALACTGGKSPALRYTAMVCFGFAALAVVGAGMTYDSAKPLLDSLVRSNAEAHFEKLLMWGWVPPVAACLILLVTIASGTKLRTSGLVMSVVLAASAVLSGVLLSYNHLVVNEPGIAEALIERQSGGEAPLAEDSEEDQALPESGNENTSAPPNNQPEDSATAESNDNGEGDSGGGSGVGFFGL